MISVGALGMKAYYRDCILPALLIVGGAFFWSEASKIPPSNFEPLGSAFFPKFILLVIMSLCALLICNNVWHGLRDETFPEDTKPTTLKGYLRMGMTLLLLFSYVLLINYTDISFLLLTFVYMTIFGWFLTAWTLKMLPWIFLLAGATTIIVYYLFGVFLGVFFP